MIASLSLMVAMVLAVQAPAASRTVFVDPGSVGGGCSDARSVDQAASPATPLCSLQRALAVSPGDTAIVLRRGSYPTISLTGYSRPAQVTVQAFPGEAVTVAGVELVNTDHFGLAGVKITDGLQVRDSHDLAFVRNDYGNQRAGMYFYGTDGHEVRDVLIEGNNIYNIDYSGSAEGSSWGYGIQMVGTVNHFMIRGNMISSVAEDYIQGGGDYLTVEGNTFLGPGRRFSHPQAHADLWQIFGSSKHIVFRNNVVRHTNTHTGLLFQFFDPNTPDVPHEDVTIENNLFDAGSDGYEMQIYQVRGLRIANNTVVGSRWGTLLRDDTNKDDGSDYLVVNNIFGAREGVAYSEERGPSGWGTEDHNLIMQPGDVPRSRWGPHDLVGATPRFAGAPTGDYHLLAGSPGVNSGTPTGAPPADLEGTARNGPPDIGAYEIGGPRPSSGAGGTAGLLTRLAVRPRRFAASGTRAARRHRRAGTSLWYSLAARATVRFRIERVGRGRRVGRRCVASRRRVPRRLACVRHRRVGGFTRARGRGRRRTRFSGRLGRHALRPGRYRLFVRATDPRGGRSRRLSAAFVIVAR